MMNSARFGGLFLCPLLPMRFPIAVPGGELIVGALGRPAATA